MYPTTEEVIAAVSITNVDWCLPIVKQWKKEHYNRKWSKLTKLQKLQELITLANSFKSYSPTITYAVTHGQYYCYKPYINQIEIGPEPSIMSTLHEVGHALLGTSELDACRFSVAIFQKVFPKEFNQLEWKGHMLIRKQS